MDINRFLESKVNRDKGENVLELAIGDIIPNPFQPRTFFDPNQLEELAASIKEYGVLQPIIVRKVDNHYELVSGERRFRASSLAGQTTIPALIRQLSDKEVAEMALIENLQREDLSYFEEAEGYAKLMSEFNITQEEVAKKMGKSQPTIANKLRLLNISPQVRKEISPSVITERHVRSLLKLKDENLQLEVLEKIYKNNLNVRQTDDLIENIIITQEKNQKEQNKKKMVKAIKDMKIFVNTIKGAVKTIQDAGLPAEIEEKEHDEYVEIVVRLPKKEI
ncbi:MAG: nucleoid occlusion protein [Cyanobacteria bacterium SIG29]|nr:nucleoid occlusion protein [Cyanobacteria bacterium SIG29]